MTAVELVVTDMKIGEVVDINAINVSVKSIEKLRQYIKNGVLMPIRQQVEEVYKDVESVMSGEVIFPQMKYIKMKETDKCAQ